MYILVFYIKSFFFVFLIFWIIFYTVGFVMKKMEKKDRNIIYECGFLPFNNLNTSLNLSFFISACTALLYELELVILIPVIFNFEVIVPEAIFLASLFLFTILLTIIIDSDLKIIRWLY